VSLTLGRAPCVCVSGDFKPGVDLCDNDFMLSPGELLVAALFLVLDEIDLVLTVLLSNRDWKRLRP